MTNFHFDAASGIATPNMLRRRSVELLEFPLIREQLAAFARLPISRELALELDPAYDAATVARRQQETAEALLVLTQGSSNDLAMERDTRPLLERVGKGGVLTGEELIAVADALELVRRAKSVGTQLRARTPQLRAIARNIPDFRQLEQRLRKHLTPSGELADDATPYLRQLRQEGRKAYRQATTALERFIDSSDIQEVLQERLITVRAERLVVPLKAEFRGRMPGIVHDVSDSGATLFIEPLANVPLCNAWRECTAAEQEETERILRQLCGMVAHQATDITHAMEAAGRMDLALAKARYAQSCRGTAVEAPEQELRLVDARHPLLSGPVVPVSLALEPPLTGLVITGPNMGGKTVALKALGLLVLMHQAGLQVPVAPTTRLAVVDGVYADIGDQQSIEHSVSTFSSHISAITGILDAVTPRSLVLLDELGTSTDPEEGSALARAILAHLAEIGVPTVITTHHRTVAAFAEEHLAMRNASVELDPATLKPTYRLTVGLPGRSYAMAVAQRLGLDARVLEAAGSFLHPDHQAAEALLATLQEERYRTRLRLQEAETAQAGAEGLRRELEQRLEEVERARVRVVEETKQQLQGEARALMTRLKQAEVAAAWEPRPGTGEPPPPRVSQEAREQVAEVQRLLRSRIWGQPSKAPRRRGALAVGDVVEVSPLGFTGTVTAAPDDAQRVEVLVGSARIRLDASRLHKVAGAPEPPAPGRVSVRLRADRPVLGSEPELDLRGLRLHESLERLDRFLDDALAQGAARVRIIHGKGTGVLRQGVWKHLASHPAVRRYDFASAQQGGDGATDVEFA